MMITADDLARIGPVMTYTRTPYRGPRGSDPNPGALHTQFVAVRFPPAMLAELNRLANETRLPFAEVVRRLCKMSLGAGPYFPPDMPKQ